MTDAEWQALNDCYHGHYLGSRANDDDPRWVQRIATQADVIQRIDQMGLLPRQKPWVDWGCGDGKLADLLSKAGLATGKYDEFMGAGASGRLAAEDLAPGSFDVVISTSVFEHFRRSGDFAKVLGLVSDSGVFALHTLVRESVSRDTKWFYLLPVHCAFFTNASMQVLFDNWGFSASLYAVDARMWFWFRTGIDEVESVLRESSIQRDGGFQFKRGFVDYWRD